MFSDIGRFEMNVFLAMSRDYVTHALELIYSLRKHSKKNIHVYLMVDMSNDLIDKLKEQLDDLGFNDVSFEILNTQQLDQLLNIKHRIVLSKMTYGRIMIFKHLAHLDRILYLDTDMLIVNDGIDQLYETDLQNTYAAAVEDVSMKHFNATEMTDCGVQRYFNAGMVLFDVQKIIHDNLHLKMLNMLECPPDFLITRGYSDQSILNTVFHENVKFVDPIFNIQSILFGYPQYDQLAREFGYNTQYDMIQHAVVSHMQGAKPWESRWETWQAWQLPMKNWQKDYYLKIKEQLLSKFPYASNIYRKYEANEACKLRIFVGYSFDAPIINVYSQHRDIFKLVSTGEFKSAQMDFSDSSGKNISSLNKYLNEFTVMYWVAKNYLDAGNPEYIGFSQYQRVLVFDSQCLNHEIVFAAKTHLNKTIYDDYAECHVKRDIDLFIEKFIEISPSAQSEFTRFLNQTDTYMCGMFVMHRDIFKQFFAFFEKCIDIVIKYIIPQVKAEVRSSYQMRACEFLLERAIGFWLYLMSLNKTIQIKNSRLIEFNIESPYQAK